MELALFRSLTPIKYFLLFYDRFNRAIKIEIARKICLRGLFEFLLMTRTLCVSRGGGITLSQQNIGIIELDERLASDPNGVELKKLVERLVAGKQRVVRTMDRGVGKDEYARLTSLAQAYDAGVDALPKLWASINEDMKQTQE